MGCSLKEYRGRPTSGTIRKQTRTLVHSVPSSKRGSSSQETMPLCIGLYHAIGRPISNESVKTAWFEAEKTGVESKRVDAEDRSTKWMPNEIHASSYTFHLFSDIFFFLSSPSRFSLFIPWRLLFRFAGTSKVCKEKKDATPRREIRGIKGKRDGHFSDETIRFVFNFFFYEKRKCLLGTLVSVDR